jgi:hypothetical protein
MSYIIYAIFMCVIPTIQGFDAKDIAAAAGIDAVNLSREPNITDGEDCH